MIKSVFFPSDGTGYIHDKPTKPEKPIKGDYKYHKGGWRGLKYGTEFDEESYNADMAEYKEGMKVYRKTKDKYLLPCAYNLIGKTFNFEDGKINILFGPNASGKTTILKAIAGKCIITDGFTKLLEPMDIRSKELGENATVDNIKMETERLSLNTSVVEWTGNPVYYDNFSNRKNTGMLGCLTGSFLENTVDEACYILDKNRISSGQNTSYIFGKIAKIISRTKSLKSLVEKQRWGEKMNDTWESAYNSQLEYFSQFPDYGKELPATVMFDEIDKSLDIETIWRLYTEYLPAFLEKWRNQFIMVSHSPIILSDEVCKSDKYNIISLDENYTESAKEILKKAHF